MDVIAGSSDPVSLIPMTTNPGTTHVAHYRDEQEVLS